MVVDQLLKYGEFGIVLFDNFQVTERTRNQFVDNTTRGFESLPLRQKVQFHPFGWIEPLFFVLCSACKSHTDCPCTVELTVGIKVAVNIRGSTHIRVTEPILDHLHRYFIRE